MKSLRSLALFLILLLCVPLTYDSLVEAQSPSVITTANLTFTTIDVPGAGYTGVFGINTAGDMVGNYGQDTNSDSHGFLYRNGTFTYFDYPGQTVTVPTGINDSGLIVGYAGQNPVVGFRYDGTTFTSIQHGHDSATATLGINNAGVVVGGTGTIYVTRGFEMRNGRFKLLDIQGANAYVYGSGVNSLGVVVGWTDKDGFVCGHGSCQTRDIPGADQTQAKGINDHGIVVGWYGQGSFIYGFAAKNGKHISIQYPGAKATAALGINRSGQIVGEYTFDYQTFHGFVTNPVTAADFE
jgi:hypothetical protein